MDLKRKYFFRGKICQNIGSSTQEDEKDTFCALLQYVCTHSKGVLSLVNDHGVLFLCKKRGGMFDGYLVLTRLVKCTAVVLLGSGSRSNDRYRYLGL